MRGNGGPGTSSAQAAPPELQTIRPDREPGTATPNVGDVVREINAPDPDVTASIDRLEGEMAPELGRVESDAEDRSGRYRAGATTSERLAGT